MLSSRHMMNREFPLGILKYEDYCMERGITYEELTEDDFETIALKELKDYERYMDE